MDLESAADELYGVAPGEFTAAREAKASEAKGAGDRDLSLAIHRLRRPSVSAWVANLLVRRRSEQVTELIDLGAAMRAAQERLAGDELRRLSDQRQRAVVALRREARGIAEAAGQRLSPAAEREVEGTLQAALVDPVAAEALHSGRLTVALDPTGFGGLALGEVVAGVGEAGAGVVGAFGGVTETGGRQKAERRGAAAKEDGGRGDQGRERERLEDALRRARGEADQAGQEAGEWRHRAGEARAEQDRLDGEIGELDARLRRMRAQRDEVAGHLAEAQRSLEAAEQAARSAEEALRSAEEAVQSAGEADRSAEEADRSAEEAGGAVSRSGRARRSGRGTGRSGQGTRRSGQGTRRSDHGTTPSG